jgi:hypothetical protein
MGGVWSGLVVGACLSSFGLIIQFLAPYFSHHTHRDVRLHSLPKSGLTWYTSKFIMGVTSHPEYYLLAERLALHFWHTCIVNHAHPSTPIYARPIACGVCLVGGVEFYDPLCSYVISSYISYPM